MSNKSVPLEYRVVKRADDGKPVAVDVLRVYQVPLNKPVRLPFGAEGEYVMGSKSLEDAQFTTIALEVLTIDVEDEKLTVRVVFEDDSRTNIIGRENPLTMGANGLSAGYYLPDSFSFEEKSFSL